MIKSSYMPILPDELLSIIFSHLDQDGSSRTLSTIQHCSHRFHRLVTPYLYRQLRITQHAAIKLFGLFDLLPKEDLHKCFELIPLDEEHCTLSAHPAQRLLANLACVERVTLFAHDGLQCETATKLDSALHGLLDRSLFPRVKALIYESDFLISFTKPKSKNSKIVSMLQHSPLLENICLHLPSIRSSPEWATPLTVEMEYGCEFLASNLGRAKELSIHGITIHDLTWFKSAFFHSARRSFDHVNLSFVPIYATPTFIVASSVTEERMSQIFEPFNAAIDCLHDRITNNSRVSSVSPRSSKQNIMQPFTCTLINSMPIGLSRQFPVPTHDNSPSVENTEAEMLRAFERDIIYIIKDDLDSDDGIEQDEPLGTLQELREQCLKGLRFVQGEDVKGELPCGACGGSNSLVFMQF